MKMRLEFVPLTGIPEIQPGSDLCALFRESATEAGITLGDSDVLVVAQKVVSKAEGRVVRLDTLTPSSQALALAGQSGKDPRLVEAILGESRRVVRARGDVLICETHHGFICANAGVDRSNVDGGDSVTLLPVAPDLSAARLAHGMGCGVIITDTFGRPWREGLVDVAIGLARVPPFVDFRGGVDAHDFPLRASVLAAADALAAAAGLVMGKAEQTPAVVIRGFAWEESRLTAQALLRPKEKDLFL